MVVGTQMLRRKFGARHKTAMGHWRRFDREPAASGIPRLTDIFRTGRHVSKVPEAEVADRPQPPWLTPGANLPKPGLW
jgi:hypothetical protein